MKKLFIMIILITLYGCSTNVKPNEIAWAEKVCKNNDGIKYIETLNIIGLTSYPNVICNNGAKFTSQRKNFQQ